jgi:large subunit ribosomal protein L29
MKTSELREKSAAELQDALHGELESQFKLRMQKSTGQLNQTHLMAQIRKNIARIKTVLNEQAGN